MNASLTTRPRTRLLRRRRGLGDFSPPSYFDTGWASVFVAYSQSLGIDPLDAAALIIGESGWNPGAVNPSSGNIGLNQLTSAPVDGYGSMTVSQQIPYVFAYWAQQMQNAGLSTISGRDLYWLNWVPALYVPNSPDSYVIQTSSDPYYSADLDIGNKGYITAGDLQTRLDNQRANNPDLWSYLQTSICEAGGCFPSTTTMAIGGLVVGFVGYFVWTKWRR